MGVAWASMSYPILYLGASWVISVAHWMRRDEPKVGEDVPES